MNLLRVTLSPQPSLSTRNRNLASSRTWGRLSD
jgi:hypothetical protein